MHRRMHLICGLCCCTQFVGHVFAFCAYPAICKCDVIYVWKCLWQQKWKWFIQLSSVNLLLAFTKISHATHRLNGGVNTRIKLHQIECINLFAVFFAFDFLAAYLFYRLCSMPISTAIKWFLCFSIFITTTTTAAAAHSVCDLMWFLVGQHQHWVIWSYYFFCCCCSLSLWCLNRKFARVTRESKKNTSNFNHTLLNWMWWNEKEEEKIMLTNFKI